MSVRKGLLMVLMLAAVGGFFLFDLGQQLNLPAIKARQVELNALVDAHPWLAAGSFFLVYVAVTAVSLPGSIFLTLLAGALFGLLGGVLLVSLAATLGASLSMLVSRFLLGDWMKRRFGRQVARLDKGIEREGAMYLFTLRLIPVVPFVLLNPAMGLTRLPLRTFWWVTQLGMLPGTLIYVNAGQELSELQSLAGIVSPELVGTLVLVGLFPLLARVLLGQYRTRRVYADWRRPERFERNLVVIGAGPGGLAAARFAASLRARVSLIEKHRMGGASLHGGGVPSKALIRSARLAHALRQGGRFGMKAVAGEVDFATAMERLQRVIARIAPDDLDAGPGVEVIRGEARVLSPWEVEVDGRRLTTRAIIIATGSRPRLPAIPGIEAVEVLTSDTVWTLRECPRRLLVLGGGPVGCELAQALQRLGCQVTLVSRSEGLLGREDREAGVAVVAALRADGVDLRLGHEAVRFGRDEGGFRLVCRGPGGEAVVLPFDRVLVAQGRVANREGFGLEALGLDVRADGSLDVDDWLATRFPNLYAIGDVTGPLQLAHAAAHQARYAVVNALFSSIKRFRVDERVMPWVTFTAPEVAQVGLGEREARAGKVAYEVTRFDLGALDRALIEGAPTGFVKVLTVPGRDRILGVTIVGEHAGELIAEFGLAMRHKLGLKKLLDTLHSYPTLAEAGQAAAGQWRRAHAPRRLLAWVERLHHWRRDGRAP